MPRTFLVASYNGGGDSWDGQVITPSVVTCKTAAGEVNGEIQCSAFSLESASPNPFKDRFEVNFNLTRGSLISYEVLNSLGQVVVSDKITFETTGEKHLQINSAALPSGSYIVRLIATDSFGQQSHQSLKVTKTK